MKIVLIVLGENTGSSDAVIGCSILIGKIIGTRNTNRTMVVR